MPVAALHTCKASVAALIRGMLQKSKKINSGSNDPEFILLQN